MQNQSCVQLPMATTYVWIVCSLADTTGESGWFDFWTTAERCQLIPLLATHWDCISLKHMGSNFMAQSLMTMIVWSSNRSSVSCLAWSCWKVLNKWASQASMLETEWYKSHLALSFCFSRSQFLRVSAIAFRTLTIPLHSGHAWLWSWQHSPENSRQLDAIVQTPYSDQHKALSVLDDSFIRFWDNSCQRLKIKGCLGSHGTRTVST